MTSLKSLGRAAIVAACSTLLLAACGGQSTATGASATPSVSPSATPSPTPSPTPAAAPVVLAQSVGTMGTILVAASNSHTVYTFNSDSPGVSRCNGGCATSWPPLTIAAGMTPTRRSRCDRSIGNDHPRRRVTPGDLQGLAALFLSQRHEAGRHHGQLHRLEPGQALMVRVAASGYGCRERFIVSQGLL
jgi:zona occludens toxin (predicted ATPase)